MKEPNYKITPLQIGTLTALAGHALFVGLGTIIIYSSSNQDSWLVAIMGLLLSIIPIMLILYVANYKPDKNIFEKNKLLFGTLLGNILNLIMALYFFFLVTLILWSTNNFVLTQYLSQTPQLFISLLLIVPAVYAVVKGIETIARTSEVLLFVAGVIIIIIGLSLFNHTLFYRLKPYLTDGIIPVIKNSFLFISYCFTPLIALLVIPKNNVINNKKYNYYFIGGILFNMGLMFFVFTMIVSTVGEHLTQIYRYPEYYVLRKVNIAEVINNIENFLSLHWFMAMFTMCVLSLYFVTKYVESILKSIKPQNVNKITIGIALISMVMSGYLFNPAQKSLVFMKNRFPYIVSLVLFSILFITCILIMIKKRKVFKAKS